MKVIGILIAIAAVGIAAAAGLVYSGWYNVAASEPHTRVTRAVLDTVVKNSVEAHARNLRPPAMPPEMARIGASHYAENCVVCHGAPGLKRSELSRGLTPRPPELSEAATEWTPSELFWIIKYGIKMTGMPAWGVTHSDDELWPIVAFITQLPDMSAEQYEKLTSEAPAHRH